MRLSYDLADPPNAPFAVIAVEAVPAALAIPPTSKAPLWLVYGDFAVPAPPGLPREDLRDRAAPRAARCSARRRPIPWFEEKVLGSTWLRRRPAVLTVAMVVVRISLCRWREKLQDSCSPRIELNPLPDRKKPD